MFAEIALAAVLGLARFETPEILQQPMPIPPRELVLRVWSGSVATPQWWSDVRRRAYRFTRYEIVLAGSYATAPSVRVTDPWGQSETITADATVLREVSLEILMDRAREESMETQEPPPCFPGEVW